MTGTYQCIICGKEFSTSRNAYNHLIKVHYVPRGSARYYVEKINDVQLDEDLINVDDVEVELIESDD